MTQFTQEDINVLVTSQIGIDVRLGLYAGPITKKIVAEHIKQMFSAMPVEEIAYHIEHLEISLIDLDDGTVLCQTE